MTKKRSKPTTLRQQKINSFLQQKISEIIQTGIFFGLRGLVTISKVEVTPDLREAKVWFSGLNQDNDEVLKILNREIYEIQGQLYKDSTMRIVPKIRFEIDTAPEYSDHINQVLRKIRDAK